jgi:hypothetical protein
VHDANRRTSSLISSWLWKPERVRRGLRVPVATHCVQIYSSTLPSE